MANTVEVAVVGMEVVVVHILVLHIHLMLDGGGSGYVYTSSTASSYPSGCLLDSSYYLINAETKAGNISFLSPKSNSNETGHSGNGYARITPVN